jgi:hypothetical protein
MKAVLGLLEAPIQGSEGNPTSSSHHSTYLEHNEQTPTRDLRRALLASCASSQYRDW